VSRIDRPRYDVRGKVLSTFWPRDFNRWNCMQGSLFLRKRRGSRRRSWRRKSLAWPVS
jgi:hypothetical protein